MTFADIIAATTGERMLGKYTGGRVSPSSAEVARLAYYFYEVRGCRNGYDVDDWLIAERALVFFYQRLGFTVS